MYNVITDEMKRFDDNFFFNEDNVIPGVASQVNIAGETDSEN